MSIAPGVAWFDGNLEVGNGTYYNTFIATGYGSKTDSIITSGSHTTYAPNYAGYSGSVSGTQYAPQGVCNSTYFSGLIPTQFCNSSTQTYTPQTIGNFAFKAGSCTGNCYSYTGGNIKTGASSNIYGNVLAGNEFNSGGSTTIAGHITALAQGNRTYNSMGGEHHY